MWLPLLGHGTRDQSRDKNQSECILDAPYDTDEDNCLHSWGLPFINSPFDICVPRFWILFLWMWLLFCIQSFGPCLVVVLHAFLIQDGAPFLLFDHLIMIQWHGSVSLQKGARLVLRVLCSHFSTKIAILVTYIFPSSDLKAKIYCVSSHVFWSEAWKSKAEIWTVCLLHGNTRLCEALARPGEGVWLLLSLCCMMNTHHLPPVSCLLVLLP